MRHTMRWDPTPLLIALAIVLGAAFIGLYSYGQKQDQQRFEELKVISQQERDRQQANKDAQLEAELARQAESVH